MVRKRVKKAALSRIFKDAWGLDTTTLTKSQLQVQLLSRGCTITKRGTPGDFKSTDSRSSLVALLHTKMPIPATHISVTAFVEDAEVRAQAEGDAAVLAMSVEGNVVTPPTVPSDNVSRTRNEVVDDIVSDDSEEDVSVSDFLGKTRAGKTAVFATPHMDEVDSSSSEDSDETSENEESDEDDQGIVSLGDKFVYSDDEEGDKTLTVRRIVRGGIVYVEEDDETLCLSYVRKKVSESMTNSNSNRIRSSRRSRRTTRRINYDENIN